MSVLITGAAGFVGAHTVRTFLEEGWQVYGYDLRPPAGDLGGATYIAGDVLDRAALETAAREANVSGIVHAAAIIGDPACQADPARAVQVNVQGTSHVLEVARQLGLRVTFVSTATLYGRDPGLRLLTEDAPVSPVGLYDATKYMAETLCFSYQKIFDLDVTVVRTSFVYGPGHAIGRYFVDQAMRGEPVREETGADHPCDYTYVKDLAKGIFLAHTVRPVASRLYNLSGGVLRRRRDLIALVRKAFPAAQIEVGDGVSETLNLRGPCSIERARQELGYAPAFTLEQGVADWIQEIVKD